MANHHAPLPHQSPVPFVTDGGLETTLVFLEKLDLPCFAAFPLLNSAEGRETLRRYYRTYAELAVRFGAGFILESPTWRANPDWAAKLGYSPAALESVNRDAIGLMREIQAEFQTPATPFLISGCLGPRGDGYQVGAKMTPEQAARYHAPQIRTYRDAGADIITAVTMTYAEEALGIADAVAVLDIPAVISFTVETDGRLPSGQLLREAITFVDARAVRPPAYYMINCAHPTHFAPDLRAEGSWLSRIVGLRANASCRSHAELDASPDLDAGNPAELGEQYRQLRELLPRLNVFGGCCGTDHRHIEAICECCFVPAAETPDGREISDRSSTKRPNYANHCEENDMNKTMKTKPTKQTSIGVRLKDLAPRKEMTMNKMTTFRNGTAKSLFAAGVMLMSVSLVYAMPKGRPGSKGTTSGTNSTDDYICNTGYLHCMEGCGSVDAASQPRCWEVCVADYERCRVNIKGKAAAKTSQTEKSKASPSPAPKSNNATSKTTPTPRPKASPVDSKSNKPASHDKNKNSGKKG